MDRKELIQKLRAEAKFYSETDIPYYRELFKEAADALEALSQPERPKGRWILVAHKEKTNYRWNVTAECSECCEEPREIWAGFFPNVPDCIVKEVALNCAKNIKTNNFCPNCGADMRGEEE